MPIEIPKFLGVRRQKDAPVLDEITQIKKIALNAADIWHKGKGNPESRNRRYREEAEKLLGFMTPELVNDPNFYGELDPKTHIRVLELLSEFVPNERSEEFESIPGNAIIVNYLKGLIRHKGLISPEQNGGDVTSVDHIDSTVRIIRSEPTITIPQYYLDNIFGENVGLPLGRDRLAVSSLIQYAPALNIAEEQRRQKKN